MAAPEITRDAGHGYFNGDGIRYPSVTTVVKATTDNAGLIGYTRRQAIEVAIDYLAIELTEPHVHQREYIADWIETAATRASLAKADLGTAVHADIETWIKSQLDDRKSRDWLRGWFDTLPVAEQRHMREFWKWEEQAKPRWLFSELAFVDECHGYGGTIDAGALLVVDSEQHPRDDPYWQHHHREEATTIDFKTGSRTWLEHVLQLAAYRHYLEHTPYAGDGAAILQVRAGEPARWKPIPLIERDFDVFLKALDHYRWMDERKELLS